MLIKGKAISAKTIRMNLKNHWKVSDFTTNYGISEEEFENLLKDLFHGNIDDIKRQLKKNGKENVGHKNEEIKPTLPVERDDKDFKQDEKGENGETVVNAGGEKAQTQNELQQLLKQEQAKANEERKQIIVLEINHKKLVSRKRAIQTEELPNLKQELEQYRAKILEAQSQVISLNDELNGLVAKINEVNSSLSEKREQLQILEEEISALKTVNIFVYSSGEIEITASTEIEVPDESKIDWISVVTNNSEQCKMMTIAQIQSVVKTIYIVKELKSWQIAFEEEICQKLFDSLMAKPQ